MEKKLKKILLKYKGKKDELIAILQDTQESFGYLSKDAMMEIAKFTHLPESRVYAVVTFYAQFRFSPIGKKHIVVCRGTACHVRGVKRILDEIEKKLNIKEGQTTSKREYSLETVACIGACGLAPNILINKKTHGRMTVKKVSNLLKHTRSKKKRKAE